jgi:hypothetical protein
MYSSVTRPRLAKSAAPSTANSSASHPTPAPSTMRPPENWSSVISMRASRTGLRYGMISTAVPILTRFVAPTSTPMVAIGSSSGSDSGAGKLPVWLYGYLEANETGNATWSASHTESKPTCSAKRARVRMASGVASRP